MEFVNLDGFPIGEICRFAIAEKYRPEKPVIKQKLIIVP